MDSAFFEQTHLKSPIKTSSKTRLFPRLDEEPSVGWLFGSSSSNFEDKNFPDFQHPSCNLLRDFGFIPQKYSKFKTLALKERKKLTNAPEMHILYRFWSYFLRENFHKGLYEEFKTLALEDAKGTFRYGMQCLFGFYSHGLAKKHRENVFQDFQTVTLQDHANGDLYGLEKFWSFLKNQEDQAIQVDSKLEKILENYKNLEDFPSRKQAKSATGSETESNPSNNPWFQKRSF